MTEFMHEVVARRERQGQGQRRPSSSLSQMMQQEYERLVASASRAYATDIVRPPSITRNGNSYVNVSGHSYVLQSNWPLSPDLMNAIARHSNAQPFNEHLMQCPQNGEGFELQSIEWTGPRSTDREYGHAFVSSHDTYRYMCIGCGHQQSVVMPRLSGLAV